MLVDEASPNNAMRGIGSLNNAGVYGLAFWASLSEAAVLGNIRMVITTGGNVGIGTTEPGARLDVRGLDTQAYNLAIGTSTAYNMVVSNQWQRRHRDDESAIALGCQW